MITRHLNINLTLNGINQECCVRYVYNPLTATAHVKQVLSGRKPIQLHELTSIDRDRLTSEIQKAAIEIKTDEIRELLTTQTLLQGVV